MKLNLFFLIKFFRRLRRIRKIRMKFLKLIFKKRRRRYRPKYFNSVYDLPYNYRSTSRRLRRRIRWSK